MFSPSRKTLPHLKIINSSIIDLPAPINISIWWNFGSLLGLCLGIQLVTGIFLAIFYIPDVSLAFSRVIHISRDINYGWLIRSLHANGASIFFLCVYIHIGRGIYYNSFSILETWNIGVILYIVLIATAFLGYVLPWGQIRFWGATVITSLLSAIPYVGENLVQWIWGGFAIDNATLTRFFTFHFLLPFIISGMTMLHILFLHQTGSNNPLGMKSSTAKIPIHSYFTYKDIVGFGILIFRLVLIALFIPLLTAEPDNFLPANPLSTPLHIKPEWYFLWLYAILRSIPNKLGGVIAIFRAILIIFYLPFRFFQFSLSISFYPISQVWFWILLNTLLILTWIGGCPVEYPYDFIGLIASILYFFLIVSMPITIRLWDKISLQN